MKGCFFNDSKQRTRTSSVTIFSEFFANNEFISPETFTQITFDSIKESGIQVTMN